MATKLSSTSYGETRCNILYNSEFWIFMVNQIFVPIPFPIHILKCILYTQHKVQHSSSVCDKNDGKQQSF
uniref:Uncharacterized protein n=1 Tax=Rhizophora mucronata TaxID=61149 RepID=A0A2P2MXD4_RHIMU